MTSQLGGPQNVAISDIQRTTTEGGDLGQINLIDRLHIAYFIEDGKGIPENSGRRFSFNFSKKICHNLMCKSKIRVVRSLFECVFGKG